MFLREKGTVQIIRPPKGGRYKGNEHGKKKLPA
jgi:hypothetical protein